MKKNIRLFFLIVLLVGSKVSFTQATWSNWGTMSCYQGFQSRVKAIGYSKVVNQYEWVAQVRNDYGIKVTLDMNWTVGGEKQSIGQFTIKPGNTTYATSFYFNSAANTCQVTVSNICFGEDAWCKCKADCDAKPGVPNQMSEEACNGLTAPPKTNTYINSNINSTGTPKTSTYNANLSNYDGGSELMPPGGRKNTTPSTNTNTKPLTPQEIQQQQQFAQQVQQQQQLAMQNQKLQEDQQKQLQLQKQAWDQQLQQQKEKLEEQQARQAYTNQYTDAYNQKVTNQIQNTPIAKLEVSKVDFKDVKKPASTTIDKGTLSGIVESTKIEMDFPELSNKEDKTRKRCTELVNFRDNQLFALYEKEFNKYILNQNSLDYVAKLKRELFEDTKWEVSDGGHTVAVLSNGIKTICNLISDVAGFDLKLKDANNDLFFSTWKAKDALEFFKTEENIYKFLSGDALKVVRDIAIDYAFKKFKPVGTAIKATIHLTENIQNQAKIESGFKQLKEDVRSAFNNIDIEIARYNQAMQVSLNEFKRYNEIKDAIDTYVSENCKEVNNLKVILH